MKRTTGYICKRCGEPSPVGVGYKDTTPEQTDVITCPCGYSRKDPVAFVLVVRHPDSSNDILTDGLVATVEIDLGSSFIDTPDDEESAMNFVDSITANLIDLPAHSPLLGAAIDTYAETVEDFPNAGAVVEAYRISRQGSPRLMWALHSQTGDVMPETGICSECLTGQSAIDDLVEVAEAVDEGEVYNDVPEVQDATEEESIDCSVCGYQHRKTTENPT